MFIVFHPVTNMSSACENMRGDSIQQWIVPNDLYTDKLNDGGKVYNVNISTYKYHPFMYNHLQEELKSLM